MARRQFMINKVSLDLSQYYFYLRGVEKAGKTTLFRDFILELYNGDATKGLLIGCGSEEGYKALDNVQAVQTETWGEFVKLVDDLIADKEENGIRFVAIDTYDELIEMAIAEVLKLHRLQKGTKVHSINEAFGGFARGTDKLSEIINEQLYRLKKAYGLIVIGHTKLKNIKEKGVQEEYSQLTSNLRSDFDNIVAHKADVIATISLERVIENGILVDTKRYINYRSDGFISCGARFNNIVPKVELSAKNFIKSIEDAIKSSSSTPLSDEEYKIQLAQQQKANEAKREAYVESCGLPSNEEMIETIKAKFGTAVADSQSAVVSYLSNNGITSGFKDASVFTTEQLQDIIDILG